MAYGGGVTTDQASVKLYLPPDLLEQFKAKVAAEDRSQAAVLRRLIREYVRDNEEQSS